MTTAQVSSVSDSAETRFRPEIGSSVPASTVRLVMAVIMVGLSVALIGWAWPLIIALFLALATLVFPKAPGAWALALLLSANALGPLGAPPRWEFFAALAGAHALHLFGMTLVWLPISGQVQLRVIGKMLRAFLIIQIPAQLIAFLVLTLLSGKSVATTLTSPVFGLAAGVGFAVLVIAIIAPTVRARSDH